MLWWRGQLRARRFWQFAYEDGGGGYLPRPRGDAALSFLLTDAIWRRKYQLITQVYGFGESSWEARTVPRAEAFHCFVDPR